MPIILFKKKPDVISFYTMANSYEFSITIAKKVKEILQDVFIVFAGPQATACAKETIKYLDFVDAVALGEGELTIKTLMESIATKKYFDAPNLCCRKNGEIILNMQYDLVSDLNSIKLDYNFIHGIEKFDSIPIEAGRGCPFSCSFCSTKLFWKQKYRLKSAVKILEEMDFLYKQYGIKKFSLEHDSLTANRKQIVELCNKFIDANRDYTWGCSSRADVLNEELIKLLYKAGCRSMFLGIETGSQRMQKEIDKNLDISKVRHIIPLLVQSGISVRCSFIYGFPQETKDDICETLTLIDYLFKNEIYDISLFQLTYLPGTELYNRYKKDLIMQPIEETSYFTFGDCVDEYTWAIEKYPELFPQYCKLKEPLPYRTKYIECFVSYLLVILNKKLKITARYLRNTHGNLYSIYEAMFGCCSEIDHVVTQLLPHNITNEEFEKAIIDCYFKYIKEQYSGRDQDILAEFIQCDIDIINFNRGLLSSCEKTYQIDIIEYLTQNKIRKSLSVVTFFQKGDKFYMKSGE